MADGGADRLLNHPGRDEQHEELFRLIDALGRAFAGPRGAPAPAAAALADSLVTHLATEERIMDDTLYPERVRHRSAHELFMADFLQFRARLREDGPTADARDWATRRIPEWLRFHISVNDYPLGVYLARRRDVPGAPRSAPPGGRRPS